MNNKNKGQNWAEWNDQMVKKYHSKGAPLESKNLFRRLIEKMRLKEIIKLAQFQKDDVVLDLGCGEGFLISLMPNLPKKIVGVDISNIALNRAKKILKGKRNIELHWGDAENLEFPNGTFNKIICSELLEHVPRPKKVITEIHRVLKNNGLLIISIPDEKRIQFIMKIAKILYMDKFLGACRKGEKYEWHLHQTDKKFITDISQGIFEIKKIYRIPFIVGYNLITTLIKK